MKRTNDKASETTLKNITVVTYNHKYTLFLTFGQQQMCEATKSFSDSAKKDKRDSFMSWLVKVVQSAQTLGVFF